MVLANGIQLPEGTFYVPDIVNCTRMLSDSLCKFWRPRCDGQCTPQLTCASLYAPLQTACGDIVFFYEYIGPDVALIRGFLEYRPIVLSLLSVEQVTLLDVFWGSLMACRGGGLPGPAAVSKRLDRQVMVDGVADACKASCLSRYVGYQRSILWVVCAVCICCVQHSFVPSGAPTAGPYGGATGRWHRATRVRPRVLQSPTYPRRAHCVLERSGKGSCSL